MIIFVGPLTSKFQGFTKRNLFYKWGDIEDPSEIH